MTLDEYLDEWKERLAKDGDCEHEYSGREVEKLVRIIDKMREVVESECYCFKPIGEPIRSCDWCRVISECDPLIGGGGE